MPDISKCEGTECPIKAKCWRYTSPSSEFRQSYFQEVPFNHSLVECDYFLLDSGFNKRHTEDND